MARIPGLVHLRHRPDALDDPGPLAAVGGDVLARSGNALGLAGDIAAPRRRPVSTRLQTLGVAVDRVRRRPRADVRQVLLVAGAVCMGLGLVAIVLGWYGASHSAYLFQEIPYLISGGLLGVALVAGGGFLFFAAWIVRLLEEQRRFSTRVEETLEHVDRALAAVAAEAGHGAFPAYPLAVVPGDQADRGGAGSGRPGSSGSGASNAGGAGPAGADRGDRDDLGGAALGHPDSRGGQGRFGAAGAGRPGAAGAGSAGPSGGSDPGRPSSSWSER